MVFLRYTLKKGLTLKALLKKLEVMFLCILGLTYADQWCNMFINPLLLVNCNVFTIGSNILNIIKDFVIPFNNFAVLLTKNFKYLIQQG